MSEIQIPKAENFHIEFKSEKVSSKNLAREIAAFANAEGGEIWLGVDDNREISGLSRSYEEDIMNICRTGVIPPIQPVYEPIKIDDKEIARIIIQKGVDRPYYTSDHYYYIRVGSTKRIASRQELIRLFQASGLFHYDLIELDYADKNELNYSDIAGYFSRYQISFSSETKEEKDRLLIASNILGKNNRPTLGGLLIFGVSPETRLPQSGVAFAHFVGNEIGSELIDKKTIGGNLQNQVNNTLAAIKANLKTASWIEGAKRIEKPFYPEKVFRELVVNACVHRNYSITGSQIRIFLFQDRIEFISPGRLPNTITVENIKVGASFSRNPFLVRLMENLGYMDQLGRGLPMVFQEAGKLKKNVDFLDSGEEFRVILEL